MKSICLHLIIYVWAGMMLAGCERKAEPMLEAFPVKEASEAGWRLMDFSGTPVAGGKTFACCPSAVVGGMFTVPQADGSIGLYRVQDASRPVSSGRFAQVGYFFEPVALAQPRSDHPLCIIDKQGEVVAWLNYYPDYQVVMAHNFSCRRALIGTGQGKFGFADTEGKLAVPPVYDFAADYSEEVALVGKSDAEGRMGFFLIDADGKTVAALRQVGCAFDTALSDGRLVCRFPSGRYGALNAEGDVCFTLPDSVLSLSRFRGGVAVARTRSGEGLFDVRGRQVLPCRYDEIEVLDKNRLAVLDGKKWRLADLSGRQLAALESCPQFFSEAGGLMPVGGQTALVRTDGSVAVRVDSARVDLQALRLRPEVFVRAAVDRQAVPAETEQKQPGKMLVGEPDKPVGGQGKKRPVDVGQTDWRKVARNSPFYQEAAKVLSGKLQEDDADNRRMILNYVEHLRTSYTTKDIDFLNQLFSDDALIIVGHTVQAAPRTKENQLWQNQVSFSVKTKKEYLERLRKVFDANKEIDLKFSRFYINRHPSVKGIYGVTLHQQYRSDRYADDGWLFLLWDFREKDAPRIHVRTWQPGLVDGKVPLPEDDVVNIGQFNLN